MEGFYAKKRFGQNFLVDRNVLLDITECASVSPSDVILEVGPGYGTMTKELLDRGCARLYAVELDIRFKDVLEKLASDYPGLQVVWGDAVKVDYEAFFPFPNKVAANIPYNITTPLIWRLLTFAPRGMNSHVYMVQKEAADRLTAARDTKDRYPLGVSLEVMGEAKVVRRVPPACFRPVPRVDSAVVKITLTRNFHLMLDSLWSDLLHAGFRQRRKTLVNNLKGFGGVEDWRPRLELSGIEPKIRAEDLSGDEWLRLYSALSIPM
ncbi:MAG: 16S rRNA (adenine(1518)-N(6)/adenine(1519)-N(6))-dimethyltransferase RsmA [Synergistaceae bacterium]|nr:16S rRNA (adenine(1518)-N(6)/adenine(1519)-N(6))-dimethyltransferase RsmA [Synergistaceae bacterium]